MYFWFTKDNKYNKWYWHCGKDNEMSEGPFNSYNEMLNHISKHQT